MAVEHSDDEHASLFAPCGLPRDPFAASDSVSNTLRGALSVGVTSASEICTATASCVTFWGRDLVLSGTTIMPPGDARLELAGVCLPRKRRAACSLPRTLPKPSAILDLSSSFCSPRIFAFSFDTSAFTFEAAGDSRKRPSATCARGGSGHGHAYHEWAVLLSERTGRKYRITSR